MLMDAGGKGSGVAGLVETRVIGPCPISRHAYIDTLSMSCNDFHVVKKLKRVVSGGHNE